MMRNLTGGAILLLLMNVFTITLHPEISAKRGSEELKLIYRVTEALGGKSKVLAIGTIRIVGHGQNAYQDGGGNISASPYAPQKWNNFSQDRVIDYANNRMRLKQRFAPGFAFVWERSMRGQRFELGLDGDVAYYVHSDGHATRLGTAAVRARRIEMLNNPIGIVRAGLDPATKLSNLRSVGGMQAIDLVTANGEQLTLAVNPTTILPEWVSWVHPNPYLGELTLRTYFVGYQLENGVQVPYGYSTVSDFRDVVQEKLDVDRTFIDAQGNTCAPAPEVVRSAPTPADAPAVNVEVVSVAKGIWYLKGQGNSTAFEFADHITVFEPFASENNMRAILERARSLVPGKPVTQIIASHHHFDHNGGLRTAVAEGLEIITHRDNVELFQEMVSRPAKMFPDALARNPKPLRVIPVDEKLVLKDQTMEVHVLRAVSNNHMATAVFAYVPRDRIVAQGDLFDEGWEFVWWGNSYPESVKHWNIQVDKDLAVHGNINSYDRVLAMLHKQATNAKRFCDEAVRDDYTVQGCPVTNVDF